MAFPQLNADLSLSDDEIYFGKLTFKEVKRHLSFDSQRKTIGCCSTICPNDEDQNDNFKLIETCSEPNISVDDGASVAQSVTGTFAYSSYQSLISPNITLDSHDKTSDDSFLNMERLVTEMCSLPGSTDNLSSEECDNTLDEIDNILRKGKEKNVNNSPLKFHIISTSESNSTGFDNNFCAENQIDNPNLNIEQLPELNMPEQIKIKYDIESPAPEFVTPLKTETKKRYFDNIPTPTIPEKTAVVFKTPANPSDLKKSCNLPSAKKTPIKQNAYDHIRSPVASYINNSPQVPLLKDIRPKKPLPGSSSIPKYVKGPSQLKHNKENFNLPTLAYRSAKETKVIQMADSSHLPQSQWAKKIVSSLPRPMIIRHDHRENVLKDKKAMQSFKSEESFDDLTLHQADVSVWTQKSALPTGTLNLKE